MRGPVLVLNSGSSSVKCAVVDPADGSRSLTALAERVGTRDAVLHLRRGEEAASTPVPGGTVEEVVARLLAEVAQGGPAPAAVGHRVVHGGASFSASALVDDAVLATIEAGRDLAPLHVPANVAGLRAARAALPDLPHVAVFDTAFHQSMPPRAYRYAVPEAWYVEHGVRRYGFHGTSHRYVSARAAELLGRPLDAVRLVTAHLGNGCSAAAVRDGVCVDTTMGLTPLEGLVMGTRSGDVDPGVLGHVADRTGADLHELLAVLNTRSGLLGLSGTSNDLRAVSRAAQGGSAAAALAIEVFCYRLAKHVAALVVPLGRLDALVFTGGIGEHSAHVRSAVLADLGHLGLVEDASANADSGRGTGGRITAAGTSPAALVVPTDEELVIARDTAALAAGEAP